MMRKVFSVALLATLACVIGLAQSAWAGVTIDLQFQDQVSPTGITINPGDDGGGPGCVGLWAVYPSGRCMDVIVHSTWDMVSINAYVAYDSDNGLGVNTFMEWMGPGVTFTKAGAPTKSCGNFDGVMDDGTEIGRFECQVPPPNATTPVPAGTYRIGTIVWNTAGATIPGTETISVTQAIIGAVINGVVVNVNSVVVVGSHILTIVPEPGTASLLGLGMIGLILAGRRSRA